MTELPAAMALPPATGARVGPWGRALCRHRCFMGALAVLLLSATGSMRAQPVPPRVALEYAVKATYLYKLAPFVDWPPSTFASATTPFVICVVGPDPFDGFLVNAVAERRFGTHPFVVHKLHTLSPGSACRIVFISRLNGARLRRALAAVAGAPVLTVTDSHNDRGATSIIHFVIDKGHVRFDVNLEAAARNHLTISSKLLHLAVAVKGRG